MSSKTLRFTAALALLALTAGEATAQERIPYRQAFDGASAPSGWQLRGLWAADGTPSRVPGGAASSGAKSLNFNNDTDYAGVQRAAAASPTILGLAPLAHTLTFRCNYQTETTGTAWDRRTVVIRRNGEVAVERQLSSNASAPSGSRCGPMGVWHAHTIEVPGSTSARTQGFQVEFVFDSVDAYSNDHAGWFVDDFAFDAVQRPAAPAFDTLARTTRNFQQYSVRFEIDAAGAVGIYQSSPTARYAPLNGQATPAELAALQGAVTRANLASIPASIPDPNVYIVAPTSSQLETTSQIAANVNSIGSSLGIYGQWAPQLQPVMAAIDAIQSRVFSPAPPAGPTLTFNQPATAGSIAAGEVDSFKAVDTDPYIKIFPPVQRTYTFETTVQGNMDTILELYAADDQTLLATDDDGGQGLASRIVLTADAGSTFHVKVRHYSSSGQGDYTVVARSQGAPGSGGTVTDDHGNTPATATVISTGAAPTAGSIDPAGDIDLFKINQVAIAIFPPPVYQLTIETTVVGNMDTVLELYAANGTTLLASNDDAAGLGLASRVVYAGPASSYVVKVRHYSSSGQGDYTVRATQTLVP